MTIDFIMLKGQSGEILSATEMEALMLHAIDLLKYIEEETRISIDRAHNRLASQYALAA
ncbi:MAG: hypothetical protein WAX04_10595 [Oscillospiraceae bacterium]